jgi:hypothetical protein
MTMIDVWESIKPKTQTDSFVSLVKRDLIPTIGKENLVKIAKNYAVTKFTVYDGDDVTPPYTPTALIKEITDKLTDVDFSTAKFLVIYTVEWANYLHAIHGVPSENITVVCDSRREQFCRFAEYSVISVDGLLSAEFNQDENMKFDVVVGNPPFQETLSDGSRKDQASNLWSKFWKKSLLVTKNFGTVGLITPTSWLSPSSDLRGEGKFGRETRLWDVFMKYDTYADVINVSKHFQGIGSTFGYVIVNKSRTGGIKFSDGADTSLGFLPKSGHNIVVNELNLTHNLDSAFKVNQDNTPDLRISIPLTRTLEEDSIEILNGNESPTKGSDKDGLYLYVHVNTRSQAEIVQAKIIRCLDVLNVHCRWNGFMNIKTVKLLEYINVD